MAKLVPFGEAVNAAGGKIIQDPGDIHQAPTALPPICAPFLDKWPRFKGFGFLNGWTSDTEITALHRGEIEIWNTHYGSLISTLDKAGETGIVLLPNKDGSGWFWYFAFAFPTFSGRPCGRILIQPACSLQKLEAFETRLGQPLPPIARMYYRVMGAMLFPTDLRDRFGIVGIDESNFGSMANETEPRLGLEKWVPWGTKKPGVCIGYMSHPDELWIAKDSGEQIYWVGHDPGEVQAYMDDFGCLVNDFLLLVEEERWHEASPRELATMGYDALRAEDYTKAIKFYLASVDAYESKNDEMGKFSAMGWLAQAYRKAGKNSEAFQTAVAIIRKIQDMGEINPQIKVAAVMAVEEATTVLLARNEPEQVLKITTSIVNMPKIRDITRWAIMVCALKALLTIKDQAGFLEQWKILTHQIYEARNSKFPPAEPNLQDIVEMAEAFGWAVEFKPKG